MKAMAKTGQKGNALVTLGKGKAKGEGLGSRCMRITKIKGEC